MKNAIFLNITLVALGLPCLSYAQGVSDYAGAYLGAYSGTDSGIIPSGKDTGTWNTTVDSSGALTVSGYSNGWGVQFGGSGHVAADGSISGTTSVGSNFTGSINLAAGTLTASWTNSRGTSGNISTTLIRTVDLAVSWNLLGNGANAPLAVASAFGDPAKVMTVWKWEPAGNTSGIVYPAWAFFAPNAGAVTDNGKAYAASKGYDFLTTINPGEGFWVNAKTSFTAQLPVGTPVQTAKFKDQAVPLPNGLPSNWSLIAVGDNPTASSFNIGISSTPPATGAIPNNLLTLWAWDAGAASWRFYAPLQDSAGTLAAYNTGKGYLNFGTKALDPTTGFWVNHP